MTSDQLHECIIMDINNDQIPARVASKRSFTNGETTVINRYQSDINTSIGNLRKYETETTILASRLKLATEALQTTTTDYLAKKKELEDKIEVENSRLKDCERELSVIGGGSDEIQNKKTPVRKRLLTYVKTVVLIVLADALSVAVSWAVLRESFAVSDILKRCVFLGMIGLFAIIENGLYLKDGRKIYFWAYALSLSLAFISTVNMILASELWAPKLLSVQTPSFSLDQVGTAAPADVAGLGQFVAKNPGLVEALLSFLVFLTVHIYSSSAKSKSQSGGDESSSRLDQMLKEKKSEMLQIEKTIDYYRHQIDLITAQYQNDLEYIKVELSRMEEEQSDLLSHAELERQKIANMICDIIQDLSLYRTTYLRTYSRMKAVSTPPSYDLATADDIKEYFNI